MFPGFPLPSSPFRLSQIDLAGDRTCRYLPSAFQSVSVIDRSRPGRASLWGRQRLLAALLGIGLLALLAVARTVEPDRRGFGTHRQLGLPPCTFRVLFDRPCPSCGMTTAWAFLVRGELIAAGRANLGGTLLGVLVLVAAPWLLVSVAAGRWLVWTPNDVAIAWTGATIVLITLIVWGFRLATG